MKNFKNIIISFLLVVALILVSACTTKVKKTDYLTEYTNAKNVELESMQKTLQNSDDFYKKLYNTLAKIAESGSYSMILSLQESNAILWYSSSVDITNQVISELGL